MWGFRSTIRTMELLIGTVISALATAFVLGIIELILPASFYRFVKILATYPINLVAFWYLGFTGFEVFVAAGAASLLALVVTIVVEKLSTPQTTVVNNNYRRNL